MTKSTIDTWLGWTMAPWQHSPGPKNYILTSMPVRGASHACPCSHRAESWRQYFRSTKSSETGSYRGIRKFYRSYGCRSSQHKRSRSQLIGGESQTCNCSIELRVPCKSAVLVSLVGLLQLLRTEACGFKLAYKCHRSTNPKQLQRRSPSHHSSKRI